MFCTNCGKEVEDTWKQCPYCGKSLTTEEKKSEDNPQEVFKEEPHKGKSEKDQYSIIRIVLKAAAIITFVCFFCPLYMVSCAGQELLSVSGLDLMTGIEYMGEQMDGNIAYGLLGLFPLLGVISAFRLRKKLVILEDYEKMKSIFYEISISGGTAVVTIFFFTRALEDAFAETGLTIDTCIALTIMTLGSILLFAVSGYQAYKLEKDGRKSILKCLGSIAGGILVGFFIVLAILYVSGAMDSEAVTQDYASESTQISAGQKNAELSELDMENFFGQEGTQLEELGFEKNEETGEYTALDGAVYVSCTNDTVDAVMLEGTGEDMPAFHGVKTGMDLAEADSELTDVYSPAGQTDNQTSYMNMDTGINIVLETEGELISCITVTQMSEEEIAAYMQSMYIFPDSDKKYLSEDEVRSVEADILALGRNEIFARHGYIFGDETYKQYFESMPWYEGTVPADRFNADEVFNDFEKKNVELIKTVEDEINGVNQEPEPFIGMDGTYICTSTSDGDYTGKIVVSNITDSTADITLGALDLSYDVATAQGQIINSNTIQADIYGYIVTLTWSDSENMTASGQGELTGTDSGVVMGITDNQTYTRPLEFNQW